MINETLILLVILLIAFIPNQQQKTMEIKNTENITQMKEYNLSINIVPNKICLGENIKGNIESNMPNAKCKIYFKPLFSWMIYKNIVLNQNGEYQESGNIPMTANIKLYVECEYEDQIIKSDEKKVEVIQC